MVQATEFQVHSLGVKAVKGVGCWIQALGSRASCLGNRG